VEEASEQQMQMPPVERIDELIGVFQNSTTREWRRLIACSRHWDVLRDGVFARIDERAKGAESDDEPGEALELRRLLRRMRKVDGEVAGHDRTLVRFFHTPDDEWEACVASQRHKLRDSFFQHASAVAAFADADGRPVRIRGGVVAPPWQTGSEADDVENAANEINGDEGATSTAPPVPAADEDDRPAFLQDSGPVHLEDVTVDAEEIRSLATRLMATVDAIDRVHLDQEALADAASIWEEILSTSSTLEMADEKIAQLGDQGKLQNPALLLTAAKAWAGSHEHSGTNKEDVKEIMAHLYRKFKENMERQQAEEVRILKHLLTIEDPLERRAALTDAFEPLSDTDLARKAANRKAGWVTGVESANPNVEEDLLYCTPEALMTVINAVLRAHEEMSKGERKTLSSEAARLMSPHVIQRMYELKREVQEFM